ncbi:MAG: hypothetical protein KF861_09095 [Planctomycetaceae bacterium]|nr:hypothetical protein [Planctomycetaceae bacterium]
MTKSPEQGARPLGVGWPVWALAGLAMYAASVGPVAGLIDRGIISHGTAEILVETVYRPLELLAENSNAISDFFSWYVSFFCL